MKAIIHTGQAIDILQTLTAGSARCCVTSPPYYGLRDYGHDGQIGLEDTPDQYVAKLVAVFAEVRRVLTDDGTLWLNLGDSYAAKAQNPSQAYLDKTGGNTGKNKGNARTHKGNGVPVGIKVKDLVGIPWMVAFALRSDGWYLRSDIIWHKPNPMPESVKDRPTKAHEYVFLLSKNRKYFYDHQAMQEPQKGDGRKRGVLCSVERAGPTLRNDAGRKRQDNGFRNTRSVWRISTKPYPGAHFAVMPPALADRCIRAGSAVGDVVLDPFNGAGTTGMVARRLQRQYIGIELNPAYAEQARRRIDADAPLFNR